MIKSELVTLMIGAATAKHKAAEDAARSMRRQRGYARTDKEAMAMLISEAAYNGHATVAEAEANYWKAVP